MPLRSQGVKQTNRKKNKHFLKISTKWNNSQALIDFAHLFSVSIIVSYFKQYTMEYVFEINYKVTSKSTLI